MAELDPEKLNTENNLSRLKSKRLRKMKMESRL